MSPSELLGYGPCAVCGEPTGAKLAEGAAWVRYCSSHLQEAWMRAGGREPLSDHEIASACGVPPDDHATHARLHEELAVHCDPRPTPPPVPSWDRTPTLLVGDRVRWNEIGAEADGTVVGFRMGGVLVWWDGHHDVSAPLPGYMLDSIEESAPDRSGANAEPPGPAEETLPSTISDEAGARAERVLSGTPALYPHACHKCGAPAFNSLVTATCSRGAECGVAREMEIRIWEDWRACTQRTGAKGLEGCERRFRAEVPGTPIVVQAATREAAIEAVRRRLRGAKG